MRSEANRKEHSCAGFVALGAVLLLSCGHAQEPPFRFSLCGESGGSVVGCSCAEPDVELFLGPSGVGPEYDGEVLVGTRESTGATLRGRWVKLALVSGEGGSEPEIWADCSGRTIRAKVRGGRDDGGQSKYTVFFPAPSSAEPNASLCRVFLRGASGEVLEQEDVLLVYRLSEGRTRDGVRSLPRVGARGEGQHLEPVPDGASVEICE